MAKVKLSLRGREIPRNKAGDPSFQFLSLKPEEDPTRPLGLLDVFTPEEVVELVNRSLYQLEYQAKAHEKRRIEQSLLEAPVKEMFRELYPKQSYAKATDEQLQHCLGELKKKEE